MKTNSVIVEDIHCSSTYQSTDSIHLFHFIRTMFIRTWASNLFKFKNILRTSRASFFMKNKNIIFWKNKLFFIFNLNFFLYLRFLYTLFFYKNVHFWTSGWTFLRKTHFSASNVLNTVLKFFYLQSVSTCYCDTILIIILIIQWQVAVLSDNLRAQCYLIQF